jgi:hypothetical protein
MKEKKEIVDQIDELLRSGKDFELIIPELKQMKASFVQIVKEAHEELKKQHEESAGEESFRPPHDEFDGKFSDLMAQFNEKKKKWEEQRAHELNQNLEIKKKIISDLDKLIETEDHIGPAFEKFGQLKEKWKATGPVPNADYKDLQREYSHSIERFFYNINIYKTLKEYDLQKNLQLKLELTEKVRALLNNDSIKELRDLIGTYTNEWDEIGPTVQSEWEKVRDAFWENVRAVHKKIADHYKEQKDRIKNNLAEKEKLCEEAESIIQRDLSDMKHWSKSMKEMSRIQEEWKKIGFAGKKTNDEIWKRFRKAVNAFYEVKKEQQESLKEVFKEYEERKHKLIQRAEEMKESMDWKNTAMAYKKLQSDWKRVGATHPAREQKLWKKFRAASEHFFERRKDYFDNREEREKGNLEKKMEMLKSLKELDLKENEKAIEELQQFSKDWNGIGFVPKEDKGKVESEFQKLISEKMKSLGLNSQEIEEQSYEIKIEGFKDAENSDELLRNEYRHLDEKLRKIEATIKQYENNLGFFGGKTNNPLVQEVEKKIELSRQEAEAIKARIDLLEK